jgi:hypothetical protein
MDVLGIDVQVLFSYFWLIAAAAAADDTVAAEVRNRFLSTRRADTFRGCAVNDSGHSSVD